MRIISGKARGTKLYTLEGNDTRPTLDRVKESLFNIIQEDILDCIFLDLFSGSGAIGLEAASRGANKVMLCDNSKKAIEIIKKNIQKTHLENKVQVCNDNYEELLKNKVNDKIDIVYIDPPYETNFVFESIRILLQQELLHQDSIVIVETDRQEVIEQIEKLEIKIYDRRKYGRAYLIFLKRK